ncbi:hypothetical protein HKBW3S43_01132 [Candidatus Hakubella thermalkaliphila]|uniref:RNA polymerase sigma-70 region 4 domain-containing protein n=1 Tax=Candidatus Hakubella thermalkaliphila TaxID=2754717 RepID=A0A6V8P634_9ACTN|nr:sigma factor-like helix-turn-helix DNA-binding protein [Candidatus Hakubella thermalkaliphila]GFP25381.1 hypothetical protein HKBW3S25_00853 [Candidatus Hakubella thermalkaliphila]GFP28095.1 hypothetical protein HKBW3S33_01512 [Candidatus Hakubella thermalkaliphila]GFP35340.1 hypothetical protein HKBW3S43_01132 [Candidatus Hakubella thermalkaliphila]GFP43805.1 hypothetical protein HKBW3C_02935 [Candidatus Hakubella thermalkaliphila]
MLDTRQEVVRALVTLPDYYQIKSSSLITILARKKYYDKGRDPFGRKFLDNLEVRYELLRRLALLDERERNLLFMWYIETKPVVEIARKLHISRMHCYRLRLKALDNIISMNSEVQVKEPLESCPTTTQDLHEKRG